VTGWERRGQGAAQQINVFAMMTVWKHTLETSISGLASSASRDNIFSYLVKDGSGRGKLVSSL